MEVSLAACQGRGTVRSARSLSTSIFRQLKRGLTENRNNEALVTVGEDVLDILLNQKRQVLVDLERRFDKRITVRNGHGYTSEQFTIQYR